MTRIDMFYVDPGIEHPGVLRPRRGRPPKLTAEDRAEIASRYLAGESTVTLSAAYDVRPGTITYSLRLSGVTPRTQSEAAHLMHSRKKVP